MLNKTFVNKDGDKCKVIEYIDCSKIKVEFEDGTISYFRHTNLKTGEFKNRNTPRYYKKGFIGYGNYSFAKNKKYGDYWVRMLQRCYDSKLHKTNPTYLNSEVEKEWLNFQNFCKWMDENYKSYMVGWHLDKDIINKDNKIYSKENCCLVPRDINNLFTLRKNKRGELPLGVGKNLSNKYTVTFSKNSKNKWGGIFDTKEEAFNQYLKLKKEQIKEIANKYKDLITEKVYEAIINYEIKITD